MTHSFTLPRRLAHSQAFRTYAVLSSPVVVGGMLAAAAAGSAGAAVWLSGGGVSLGWLGVALVGGSLAVGLLLLFVFAVTYFPDHHGGATVQQLLQQVARGESVNVAEVADFHLLHMLGEVTGGQHGSAARAVERLFKSGSAQTLFRRLDVPLTEVIAATQPLVADWSWERWAPVMLAMAADSGATLIEVEHAVAAVLVQPELQAFLRTRALQEADVRFVAWWLTSWRATRRARQRWWDAERLLAFSGVGLSWTAGFTPLIDQFAHIPAGNLWDQAIVGREQYVEQLIATLAREQQNDCLLVGQPGVGRMGVVQALAQRIRHSHAHPRLNGQRVIYLHIGELLAQGTTGALQISMVQRALTEMERAGNIIAIIDGLSSVLGGDGEQRVNLSELLLPFFSSRAVRVVVVVSTEEYHLRLKHNEELVHFFEVIQIPSASPDETLQTLASVTPVVERRGNIQLSYPVLRALVQSTAGVLQHIPYPERAFDVLEEILVVVQAQGRRVVTVADVEQLVSRKVGVPLGAVATEEKDRLLNLEALMHQRVVNQRPALTAVARALVRARTGVRTTERPIGTFLFLGPTGVGKTETAKTLAHVYFGAAGALIRFDMSEFQGEQGVAALIGSAAQPVGRLTSAISDRPFAVVLLDEFEKAHPMVHQLFLQVFDEGHLTDARGHQVSFQHALIIATSNAGSELIRQAVQQGTLTADFAQQLKEHILTQNIFRPELVNRFDGVITFTPLSPAHIREVATLMLKKLNKRLDAAHGVTVEITPELLDFLVRLGYSPDFGARPMARAIQDTVEYTVARLVLEGKTVPGQTLTLPIQHLEAAQRAS